MNGLCPNVRECVHLVARKDAALRGDASSVKNLSQEKNVMRIAQIPVLGVTHQGNVSIAASVADGVITVTRLVQITVTMLGVIEPQEIACYAKSITCGAKHAMKVVHLAVKVAPAIEKKDIANARMAGGVKHVKGNVLTTVTSVKRTMVNVSHAKMVSGGRLVRNV